MLTTTTPTVEGHRITQYFGIVSGEAIMGTNVFRDVFASIRDIVGGRAAAYEKELRRAKTVAMEETIQQAKDHGANAVVGIDLDYESLANNMLMVVASGTAVATAPDKG